MGQQNIDDRLALDIQLVNVDNHIRDLSHVASTVIDFASRSPHIEGVNISLHTIVRFLDVGVALHLQPSQIKCISTHANDEVPYDALLGGRFRKPTEIATTYLNMYMLTGGLQMT